MAIEKGNIEEPYASNPLAADRNKIQILRASNKHASTVAGSLAHGEFALGKASGAQDYDLWIGGDGTPQKVILGSEFNSAIDDLQSELTNEITRIDTAIAAETSAREAAITQEKSDRAAAIAVETSAREAAITQEKSDRAAAIAAEKSDREAAISAEASARATAISNEASARTAADADINGKIQNITSPAVGQTNFNGNITAGSLTVTDLTVTGNNTVIDSTTVQTEDSIIELNYSTDNDNGANVGVGGKGGILIHGATGAGSADQSDNLISWNGTDFKVEGGGSINSAGEGAAHTLLKLNKDSFSLASDRVQYAATGEFVIKDSSDQEIFQVASDGTVTAKNFSGSVDGGSFD